ncbi:MULTISPECIES: helix-turn-helix domain-containing protein [unclassified Arcicella]|uniref:helix-turn-helix domain-containing protein n=1 Tax=unclassified Arcicella TaxID=2644986 RepID=UPI0028658B9A|nr:MULTISPECIES: helix-turn-helix domain-containing protein [unclassified Arcicella]MDR6563484.1 AraC-like DNA-binding protein [Arcicella sp. BE51]MDR6813404.1 AraC-like DNA-binding protein [Arcicella sp. BE140]MDR6824717.1 AraC-like DNA-binding protein [Arcicella sp. BE139]
MLISRIYTGMVFCLICFVLCKHNAFANETINLTNLSAPYNISSSLEYFESSNSKLSFRDIQSKQFAPYFKKNIHVGFSDATQWFKLNLVSAKTSNWVFECSNPVIEYIDVFIPQQNKQYKVFKGGCFVAKDKRSYTSSYPIIHFNLLANQPQTIFIKTKSQRAFYATFLIMPEAVHEIKRYSDERKVWILDGVQLLGNFLISIIAFFLLKTNTYKIFAIYSLCILFTVSAYHESIGDYFTNNPVQSTLINALPYRLLAIFEIVLTISFLPITTLYPKWVKWYLYLSIVSTLVLTLAIYFDYNWRWIKMNVLNTLIADFSIILLFAYAYYKKVKLEWLFVFSFIFSFTGFIFLQLRLLKVIDFAFIDNLVFFSDPIKITFFVLLICKIYLRSQQSEVDPAIMLEYQPEYHNIPLNNNDHHPPSPITSFADLNFEIEKFSVPIQQEQHINQQDEAFLQRIEQIIEAHLSDSAFNITDLADELNISTVQLRRKLKTLTNQTTVEFIRNYRLKKAAELLKNRNGNVSDVAFQVGFESLSYFTKVFQESFGKSPSEWSKSFK